MRKIQQFTVTVETGSDGAPIVKVEGTSFHTNALADYVGEEVIAWRISKSACWVTTTDYQQIGVARNSYLHQIELEEIYVRILNQVAAEHTGGA